MNSLLNPEQATRLLPGANSNLEVSNQARALESSPPDTIVHESPALAAFLEQIESKVEREAADRRAQEELARMRELARYD